VLLLLVLLHTLQQTTCTLLLTWRLRCSRLLQLLLLLVLPRPKPPSFHMPANAAHLLPLPPAVIHHQFEKQS
jgi:hypothetical protein